MNTVSPDQAYGLSVESVESTSISFSWQPPTLTSVCVLYYIINADNLNSSVGDNNVRQVNTTNNATFYNVTDLLPGTTYKLTVVAVSEDITMETDSMRQPSGSVVTTTGFTGIATSFKFIPLCIVYFPIHLEVHNTPSTNCAENVWARPN